MLGKFKWNNITIGWKYGIALMIVFLLFAIASAMVGYLLDQIGKDIDALERRGERAVILTEMGSLTRGKGARVVSYALNQDPTLIDEYEVRRKNFNALQADVAPRMDTPELEEMMSS